jgi:hypothetical protein
MSARAVEPEEPVVETILKISIVNDLHSISVADWSKRRKTTKELRRTGEPSPEVSNPSTFGVGTGRRCCSESGGDVTAGSANSAVPVNPDERSGKKPETV